MPIASKPPAPPARACPAEAFRCASSRSEGDVAHRCPPPRGGHRRAAPNSPSSVCQAGALPPRSSGHRLLVAGGGGSRLATTKAAAARGRSPRRAAGPRSTRSSGRRRPKRGRCPSRAIDERMLQATRPEAITGSTMSAAIRRMPTICIERPIVSPRSRRRARSAPRPARRPRRRPPRRPRPRQRSVEKGDRREAAEAQHGDDDQVLPRHGEDRAEEEGEEVDVRRRPTRPARLRPRGPCRRAAPAPGRRRPGAAIEPLDADGARDRGDERREHRRDAEQVPGGHAREGRVADAVPDEAHVPLDEEEADRRREDADDGPRREREPHELSVEHGRARGRATRRGGSAAGRRTRYRRARGRGGRRCPPPRRTRARRRASSRHGHGEGGRAAGRALPGTRRRRRPSARPGRVGTARRRAPWR